MKKNLPAPTAKSINDAHRCARESADNAVEWAVKCGQLLAAKKEELQHGEFTSWIEKNCDFSVRSARLYMKAAEQNGNALPFSSLRQLLAPPDSAPKSNTPKGAVSVVNPKGGRTTGATAGTEETGKDRPAAPVFDKPAAALKSETDEPGGGDEPPRPDDIDEDSALAAAEADYARRIDAVMQSDDKLAEAHAQLKQQAALIATLEMTRDTYMRGKEAVTKLLQAEQRKVARLEKEIKSLRERLGVEGKAA